MHALSAATEELELAAQHARALRAHCERVEELAALLYSTWYARPRSQPARSPFFPRSLVQALRAADASAARWEEGWVAERVAPNGAVIARRGRQVRLGGRCDLLAVDRPGLLPRAGDALVMAARRDRVDPDGHWWRTAGEAWRFTRPHAGLVRLYWRIEIARLPLLVGRLTRLLAGRAWPWMLKVATDVAVHARPDATVLYLDHRAIDELAEAIEEIARGLSGAALPGHPPLSLLVLPGLAAAFDPGALDSFGSHRSRLIAEALFDLAPADDPRALESIAERFEREGIELGRPHARRTDRRLPWER